VTIDAHASDVNVLSWNTKRAFFLLSGADDGQFCVWDLRSIREENGRKTVSKPKYAFSWHSSAITSVEWNPNDDSTFAVASEDHSISIWDLSLSTDKTSVQGLDIPSQLMFVHHGQDYIKEVHWHKQIPGVLISTAADGFNILMPYNIQNTLPDLAA
jgi:ribosome assembly protein RRB1